MRVPWLILASLLSIVRILGLEMIRSMPEDSAAERRTPRLTVLLIEPSVRPMAPAVPVPTAAGRFTAKFGLATVRSNGERPAVGVCASVAPPAMPIADGNATPVGLPVAGEKLASPPHWMPT